MEKSSKIGIVGAGIEGLAVARYLRKHGFGDVTIFDEKMGEDEVREALGEGFDSVNVVVGEGVFGDVNSCEVLFRSPGIHPSKLAGFKGEMTSSTRYFFENCKGKIVGVTGTKGKGTTSTLIYEILKADGRDVYLGGNIGVSPLEFLDEMGSASWAVLELSSFQLMDLERSPHVGVVLMTTSDHLDYHGEREEYLLAKESLLKFQGAGDFAVVNVDYDSSERYLKLGGGKKLLVSMSKAVTDGAHVEGPVMLYCSPSTCEMIGMTAKVALPGRHNLENVLAAVTAARALGVGIPTIQKAVYAFAGLPHRLELVREIGGVRYYNDSFSTTPETCVAASRAFEKGGTVLICGGSEKGSDFREWAVALQENERVKAVCLMGVIAEKMEKELRAVHSTSSGSSTHSTSSGSSAHSTSSGSSTHSTTARAGQTGSGPLAGSRVEIVRCASLEEGLAAARARAVEGDVVILSPAAASYDMFKNYKERGERFKELVGGM